MQSTRQLLQRTCAADWALKALLKTTRAAGLYLEGSPRRRSSFAVSSCSLAVKWVIASTLWPPMQPQVESSLVIGRLPVKD